MSKSFSGAKKMQLPTDLFGMAESPTKRTNDRLEATALLEVLKALRAPPAVVWCERMNSGAARVGSPSERTPAKKCFNSSAFAGFQVNKHASRHKLS